MRSSVIVVDPPVPTEFGESSEQLRKVLVVAPDFERADVAFCKRFRILPVSLTVVPGDHAARNGAQMLRDRGARQ